MKGVQHLILAAAIAALCAFGSLQGQHIDGLRDATKFYRWMISAATQARVFGPGFMQLEGTDGPEYLDDSLFQRLVQESETRLEDPPSLGASDYDEEGNVLPKIVRYSNIQSMSEAQDGDAGVEVTVSEEEELARDRALWALARSKEMEPLRTDFLTALSEGRLAGVGSQMSLNEFYDQTADFGVSLGNMFFGFRKMAANLVWLEVDKFFHSGMQHRMIPAMRTTVTLDPTFIDAYLLGAWHLAYNFTAKLTDTPWSLREYDARSKAWVGPKENYYYQGAEFLKDGIRKNPRNYKLYFDLGYAVYENKLGDHANAVRFLREAIRPAHDVWVRRQLYRIMALDERYEESIAGWRWYIEQYPDNLAAPRLLLQSEGLMLERDARRAAVKAAAADQLAELDAANAAMWRERAEAARQEEEQLWGSALTRWNEMTGSPGAGDTFAVGRKYMRQAELDAEQGRYVEAITKLDVARMESNALWDELTELMLKYKVESGENLQVTELAQIRREEETRKYTALLPKTIEGVWYEFHDGAWRQANYENQPTQELVPGTIPYLQFEFENPQIARFKELGFDVIFRIDDQWYRYKGQPLEDVIDPTNLAEA